MATKKKQVSPYDDGDSAHWIPAKTKRKRVTPSDLHGSNKYTGKGKSNKKVITTKR